MLMLMLSLSCFVVFYQLIDSLMHWFICGWGGCDLSHKCVFNVVYVYVSVCVFVCVCVCVYGILAMRCDAMSCHAMPCHVALQSQEPRLPGARRGGRHAAPGARPVLQAGRGAGRGRECARLGQQLAVVVAAVVAAVVVAAVVVASCLHAGSSELVIVISYRIRCG
jgi:hypothetical protein